MSEQPCRRIVGIVALLLIFLFPSSLEGEEPVVATFSIIARDPETGDFGVAVQSKFFNAAAIVPWAKAGVGAIATQAFANYWYGPEGLRLLEQGLTASEVIRRLTESDPDRERRQLAVIDSKGNVAHFTGSRCIPWAGAVSGPNYSAQGNILVGEEVVRAMAKAFETTPGDLADRLVAALAAGQEAGGDARGQQSAGLLVVRKGAGFGGSDRYIDLRVDDHPEPIRELQRLLRRYRLTLQIYRSMLLENEGKLEEAITIVRQVLEQDPQDGEKHYRLSGLLVKAGRAAEALQALERAIALNPHFRLLARSNPSFESLRTDPRFHRLLSEKGGTRP